MTQRMTDTGAGQTSFIFRYGELGRRSCFITDPAQLDGLDELLGAGADELIVQWGDPFELADVAELLKRSRPGS